MNNNIDWSDVEDKISLICYKFNNLSSWHEDLAQELRIHAYYVSDDYYDLYRKAIDFWRKVQTRHSPEIPYFDLELLGGTTPENDTIDQLSTVVGLIRRELTRSPQDKWEKNRSDLAMKLLDIMLADIDPREQMSNVKLGKSASNLYFNNRLNLSRVSDEIGIGYKQVMTAMKLLEDIVRGLHAMNKIEIPLEYFEGYYDK